MKVEKERERALFFFWISHERGQSINRLDHADKTLGYRAPAVITYLICSWDHKKTEAFSVRVRVSSSSGASEDRNEVNVQFMSDPDAMGNAIDPKSLQKELT